MNLHTAYVSPFSFKTFGGLFFKVMKAIKYFNALCKKM